MIPSAAWRSSSRPTSPDGAAVLTGHADGVITDQRRRGRRCRAGAAADVAARAVSHAARALPSRERALLLGSADRRTAAALEEFRALFGDERADYGAALERLLRAGPAADWQERFVSAYASAHPWEDWAETWAHYLHMVDTLETAAACGISLQPRRSDEPSLSRASPFVVAPDASVRSADRQLVPGHLHAEQSQSRPRPGRRLPVRAGRHRRSTSCASFTRSS